MKKVIGGKTYNTDTATHIGDDNGWESVQLGNFYATAEALYVTKKGQYFIHGRSTSGGRYGTSSGNSLYGGSNIRLLSADEARQWAEDNLDGEIVEQFFECDEG